jgi:hypothetical protein
MEEYYKQFLQEIPIPLIKILVFATTFGILFNPIYKIILYPLYVLLFRLYIEVKRRLLERKIKKVVKTVVKDTRNCLMMPPVIDKYQKYNINDFGENISTKGIPTDIFRKYNIYNELSRNIFFLNALINTESDENHYIIFTINDFKILLHRYVKDDRIILEFYKSSMIIMQ